MDALAMIHLEVEGPGWDTKTRCACGAEFTSRCEFWKHQADVYVELVQYSKRLAEAMGL